MCLPVSDPVPTSGDTTVGRAQGLVMITRGNIVARQCSGSRWGGGRVPSPVEGSRKASSKICLNMSEPQKISGNDWGQERDGVSSTTGHLPRRPEVDLRPSGRLAARLATEGPTQVQQILSTQVGCTGP